MRRTDDFFSRKDKQDRLGRVKPLRENADEDQTDIRAGTGMSQYLYYFPEVPTHGLQLSPLLGTLPDEGTGQSILAVPYQSSEYTIPAPKSGLQLMKPF
jgi:hypothetical protein